MITNKFYQYLVPGKATICQLHFLTFTRVSAMSQVACSQFLVLAKFKNLSPSSGTAVIFEHTEDNSDVFKAGLHGKN